MDAHISRSCILLLFLDDETFNSKWVRGEILAANRYGVDVHTLVQTDLFKIRDLTDKWLEQQPEVAALAFANMVIPWFRQARDLGLQKLIKIVTDAGGVPEETAGKIANPVNSTSSVDATKLERRPTAARLLLGNGTDTEIVPEGQKAPSPAMWLAVCFCAVIPILVFAEDLRKELVTGSNTGLVTEPTA